MEKCFCLVLDERKTTSGCEIEKEKKREIEGEREMRERGEIKRKRKIDIDFRKKNFSIRQRNFLLYTFFYTKQKLFISFLLFEVIEEI